MEPALPPELIARFAADLARLWPEGSDGSVRLGVAVSGGGDSLALLLLAHAALPGRVEAATVDHGLRAESAAEAAFVATCCAELSVPHHVFRVALPPGNVQARARDARYGTLTDWAERDGLGGVATAHQADDQAETLLMRLGRGSGIAGLAGVRARRDDPSDRPRPLPFLRPLLEWRRAELAALVERAGWRAVSDPANSDDRYDRARTRKAMAVLPELDAAMLAKSARLLGEAAGYLDGVLNAAWDERVVLTEGVFRLRPGVWAFENTELVHRILACLGGDASRGEAAAMAERLRTGSNASLAGVLARVEGEEWVFAPEPPRRV